MTIQEDLKAYREQWRKEYGWYFLMKEICEWSKVSYFEIFDMPTTAVFGIYGIMKAENEMNK